MTQPLEEEISDQQADQEFAKQRPEARATQPEIPRLLKNIGAQINAVQDSEAPALDEALSTERKRIILDDLKTRFEQNMERHPGMNWDSIKGKLEAMPQKLWSLSEMERTGGEPDVIGLNPETGMYLFFDCSPESPIGRRNAVYDKAAEDSLENYANKAKTIGNAVDMAQSMGLIIPDRYQYADIMVHLMQDNNSGGFDLSTESWVKTPDDIRCTGYAIGCRKDGGKVRADLFGANIHNQIRGFRGMLWV